MTRLQELSETFANNPLAELLNPPPLDDTFGALFLGMVLGLMVYGLTVHQAYRYFRLYPNDPLVLKLLVLAILMVETFHSILAIDSSYYHLISNYFKPATLIESHWSKKLLIPVSGLATLLCQGFYAVRTWFVAPQHRVIVSLAVVPELVFIAFTIIATVESFRVPVIQFPRFSWMISVMYGAAGLVETILTGTLIFVLRRSRTGFKRTDTTIDLLILYAVNMGLLMSTIGILGFIFPLIYPKNLIYAGISLVETKLYASCVLTALNSRVAIVRRASTAVEVSSSKVELAKEVDSEGGHGQSASHPHPNAAWNF